jgi:hypothetical protein
VVRRSRRWIQGDPRPLPRRQRRTAARAHIAASGIDRGFVAVWKHSEDFFAPSNVRARFFTSNGGAAAVGNAQITSFADGDVYGPHALFLGPNEAMVAYSAETVEDARLTNGAIVLSRFSSPAGNQVGAEVIIPAELPFEAIVPAVAQRADGTVAVSWHQCGANGDGVGCGILVQAARSSGMPVGEPTIVNTTRLGDQETPSIAPLGETFVLAWTDASMAEPDTSELGVRGRLIYLEADVRDGRLGANCGSLGQAKCGAGLVCVPGSEGSPMCHTACSVTDLVPCPGGGVCNTIGSDSACLF